MAKCDQGYLCEVCGDEVDKISDSALYLRFIIGEIDAGALFVTPERHLRCHPQLTQYIVDERFEPVTVEGEYDKRQLPAEETQVKEDLVTRGWQRLQEVRKLGIPISEYPLTD